jgi:hypothetical protein
MTIMMRKAVTAKVMFQKWATAQIRSRDEEAENGVSDVAAFEAATGISQCGCNSEIRRLRSEGHE